MTNNILCMKWGTKFDAEYVNRLFRMTMRNTSGELRFICFTDDPAGIDKRVETRPLPQMEISAGAERGWRKLSMLGDLGDIKGKCLFLDLDIVIVKNIDDFFTVDGNVLIIREWKRTRAHGTGNSSVYRFEASQHQDVLDFFIKNADYVKSRFRHEQAYMSDFLKRQNALGYWQDGWCASFKCNCMRNFPVSIFKEPIIPEDAKIIVFHGNPTPAEAEAGVIKGCKKFVRFLRPTTWIKNYWN